MPLSENKPISTATRLGAMLLDHFFMTFIGMLFFIPKIISGISSSMKISHEQESFDVMDGPLVYLGLFGFALYFCKDIINGRSIAKRILKLQVVDNKTGQVATPLQCFIRNIFCVLWIIEVIVAMTNISRRIGDRVAGTKLVHYDPLLNQPKVNIGRLVLPIILSYGFLLLLSSLISSIPGTKTVYSETSYNQTESKELEKLIGDSMGQYYTPDIRIYDSVKDESSKYVSVIMRLKENYIGDDNGYRQLHDMTMNLIYSRLPKETFTGQVKYVYKNTGQFQSRTVTIGKY